LVATFQLIEILIEQIINIINPQQLCAKTFPYIKSYENEDVFLLPTIQEFPYLPKDEKGNQISWKDIMVVPCSYYADGTGTWKTKKDSGVIIHNLMCKLWGKKKQMQFRHIYLLASFKKAISFNNQLKYLFPIFKEVNHIKSY
jgi:hypothetical protein